MTTTTRVTDWLEQRKVPYEVLAHQKAYTAQEVAGTVHVPGRAYAKVVMLRGERGLAMAVLPAKCRVNLARMQQLLGDRSLTLAKENDFAGTFSDCEIGAMSAFGNLYGVPVYLDRDLLGEETITFPAGNHHEVIRIGSRDFLGLTGAQVVEFCIKPVDPTFDLGMDPPVMVSHARTPRTCAAGACPRSGSRRFIEERG